MIVTVQRAPPGKNTRDKPALLKAPGYPDVEMILPRSIAEAMGGDTRATFEAVWTGAGWAHFGRRTDPPSRP